MEHADPRKYRNPAPTVDIIIELGDGRIYLIERRNEPRGWAIPGGFVDYGEPVEAAAIREAREETSLEVELLEQFLVYSDPARDPRQHTLSVVFIARPLSGEAHAADDAKSLKAIHIDELPADLCFDHARILADYKAYRATGQRPKLGFTV